MHSSTIATWLERQAKIWLDRFLVPIDDPGSRLFHMNILLSLIFIFIWILLRGSNRAGNYRWRDFARLFLRKKYWWNRSTKVDYQAYFLNSLLKVLLFIPFLDGGYFIATKLAHTLVSWNDGEFLNWRATWPAVGAFTLVAFIWDDLLRFLHHAWMHRSPFLWRFHQTHHSARVLTPITLYRAHPLEIALATIRNGLSLGVATGLFLFIFTADFSPLTFLGINAFGFVFNLLGSNLRHSHIDLSFGFLEKVFISPKQHQVHHSSNPEHYEKNYGVSLSIWDQILGSYFASNRASARLRFGLGKRGAANLRANLLPLRLLPLLLFSTLTKAEARVDVHVVSFNIKGLPELLLSSAYPTSRYAEIGEKLGKPGGPGIVVLQEAFNSGTKQLLAAANFPYVAKGPGAGSQFGFDSGLYVLSRYPIMEEKTAAFGPDLCLRWDCFANKGVQLVRLQVPGLPLPLEVYNTHLQAGREDMPTRERQAEVLVKFFHQQHRLGSPVIFAGDFNFRPGLKQPSYMIFSNGTKLSHSGEYCLKNGCAFSPDQGWQGIWERAVDHQFYSTDGDIAIQPLSIARTFQTEVDAPRFSDHLALEVRFRLENRRPAEKIKK